MKTTNKQKGSIVLLFLDIVFTFALIFLLAYSVRQ